MNRLDFQGWISLAWVLASPLVINKLVAMGRSDRAPIAVLTAVGVVYLLTVAGAVYLTHEAFSGHMSDDSFGVTLFFAAIAPLLILASPFVIYRLFKAKRPQWAWVAILVVVCAITVDWVALGGIAATQSFRN
ncbi:hypothetical protein [Paraburkholderia megapolitana]|uniref:hypothetical protein n=1 Tax=Paraburkholderia megapolitana TaxID=420953 RepID=UPI0038BB243A